MARINIPPLTRFLLICAVAFTICNAIIRPYTNLQAPLTRIGVGAPYLSIVPGQSLIYPWVFITATFVEQNLFGFSIAILTLFYGGRYLERAWGSASFGTFVLVCTIIPNLVVFATLIILFAITRYEDFITTTISGALPLQIAFLVSLKQLVPEHTVSLFKTLIRIRIKHFPAILLAFVFLGAIVLGTYTALLLTWTGFLTSWMYLRFFRVSPSAIGADGTETTVKGDASDTFAFAFFFPEPIHTPLAAVCDRVYDVAVAMRVLRPFSADDIESHNASAAARSESSLPSIMNPRPGRGWQGGSRVEAERRRALALRALDQRLQGTPGRSGTPNLQPPGPAVVSASPTLQAQAKVSGDGAQGPSALGEMQLEPEREEELGGSNGEVKS